MEKNILVVGEQAESTLKGIVDCPLGAALIFCTNITDVKSAECMIDWNVIDEVLVVGSVVALPLCAVIDHAEQLGAPIRRWKKPTVH
jgi:hypothetical protein